ncbi:2'-5' RNA ligase family protein [Nostoc sp. FACHB-152]|uniref:2'-5' RNA ligase family protein n=1 Tax=unclassified Nostoc TaxID=2593658 RepID=UPI001689B936|nr:MULTISPECIES: 2'-5' RNA ligase family protein [unclassified Nostoc]MBD2449384.1 2'-5' RNA ligase family protein [Nostoc sp. FACHB-152]MBD2470701.1 2'-5' RNA ligase family protein [Nostoc sp. FACHB-145]
MNRFFVALLPPQDIQDYANQIKQYFADNYASRHAQKSPPHITLQPPFEWANDQVSRLEASLREFASQQKSLQVTLSGFSAFAPRVIYIDVVRSQELLQLQAALMAHMETDLGIVDEVGKKRPFAPHMTVAFRDLTKQNFKAAWPEFENRELHFEFAADKLTLLIHDGKRWNIKSEFAFLSGE